MKTHKSLSRRSFIKNTAIASAAMPILGTINPNIQTVNIIPVPLKLIDNQSIGAKTGITWGVPWAKGTVKTSTKFSVKNGSNTIDTQSWPLAYWPDGSLKWTAHAIAPQKEFSNDLTLSIDTNIVQNDGIKIEETPQKIRINTGLVTCELNKSGAVMIASLSRNGQTIAADGKLILHTQNQPEATPHTPLRTDYYESTIDKLTVEQKGNIRSVIKIEGKHANAQRAWLPFTVRLYFYANSEAIRVIHNFVFDGNEQQDFISGLGIRFGVYLKESAFYNRHVRFVGDSGGVFAEAVQGITGLRRDPGPKATQAQANGQAVTPDMFDGRFDVSLLKYVPTFGNYTLTQASADGFDIQKRTKDGYGSIQAAQGKRAAGTGYVGTPMGGLAFGIRNFWQSYPAQLDIRNAHTDTAELTLWLWSPKAPAMDLRFYHDGMGQDTHAKQLEALEITYEDYEPDFGRPVGIARTSELQLWVMAATPTNTELAAIANQIQNPAALMAAPAYMASVGVFGGGISVPDLNHDKKAKIEKQLDFYFDYYKNQVEQRRWYGFWNFGDVMHSYDASRHVWKYDIGGFAWDNSELSTDIWLWYYFLKTGRADVFRMAEAMTRHTGEVDVHHMGPFSPLGSRHNVLHWGCSAKQLRISTAMNRRYYYYLTADERVGDLMREQVNADRALQKIIPGRKIGQKGPANDPKNEQASVAFGTDWGALAAAWLTEWERTQNTKVRDKLLNSMRTIAQQPHGFFTGGAIMNLNTGEYLPEPADKLSVSHLSAAFGLAEICAELVQLLDMPLFEKAWLQYCVLYNAPAEEQKAALGRSFDKLNLQQGHSKLTAFAANRLKDSKLAERAWVEFYAGLGGVRRTLSETKHYEGPVVLNPIDENAAISTNSTAQWGLAAIECLAYIGNELK